MEHPGKYLAVDMGVLIDLYSRFATVSLVLRSVIGSLDLWYANSIPAVVEYVVVSLVTLYGVCAYVEIGLERL